MVTTTTAPCKRCGRRHRQWYAKAKCLWPRAIWISGDPAAEGDCYVVLAHCGELTVSLWATREEAEKAKAFIDRLACGGRCVRNHELLTLAEAQARGFRRADADAEEDELE